MEKYLNKIIWGDCLEEMKAMPKGCVDLIITDPPYGNIKGLGGDMEKYKHLSNSTWDVNLDNEKLFKECERVLRENGKLILFSQEPYTSKLITEAHNNLPFNYRLVWFKDHFANCLVVNKAPVSYFEDIIVFSKKYDTSNLNPLRIYSKKLFQWLGKKKNKIFDEMGHQGVCHFMRYDSMQFGICTEKTYNDLINIYGIDKWDGFKPFYEIKRLNLKQASVFNLLDGNKFKSNILEYKKDYGGLHPTQKPVKLIEDLIKTYSNKGDLILDNCIGSGTTAIACLNTNRRFIGFELEEKYCKIAEERLKNLTV